MNNSIVVALDDSATSRAVVDYLIALPFCRDDLHITLLHVFKKPSASEELMGETFTKEEPKRFLVVLEKAKNILVERGIYAGNIEINLVTEPYPTVSDGIIDQFKKGDFNMVVIGRKRMSKAEEFVLGDVSAKLVRALEEAAVLVVKSHYRSPDKKG